MKDITVKNLVIAPLRDKIKKKTYHLCTSESCNVVYYDTDYEEIYKINDLKVPIWFKEKAKPKYICYCNQVTEEEMIQGINNGAKNLKDLIRITGAIKNCNCELNHPTGKCCSTQINEILEKYLSKLQEEEFYDNKN